MSAATPQAGQGSSSSLLASIAADRQRLDEAFVSVIVANIDERGYVKSGRLFEAFRERSRPWIIDRLHMAASGARPLPGVTVRAWQVGMWRIRQEPQVIADAWAFSHALRDPHVRAAMAYQGYGSGMWIVVGRDAPVDVDERPVFRVWPDPDVPGGWTGEVVYR